MLLKDGDKNTTFFKMTTFQRRSTNRISKMRRIDETATQKEEEIKEEVEKYYKELLKKDQRMNRMYMDIMLQNIP